MSDLFGNISIEPGPSKAKKSTPQKRARRKSPKKPQRKKDKGSGSPLLGAGVIVVLCIIGYGAAGYFGVPKMLSSWLPDKVREKSGLELSTPSIAFNPFTFALTFGNTELRDPSSSSPSLIALSSLTTQLAPLSLLRGDLVTKNLSIADLSLHIVRNKDTSYNISPVIKNLKSSENSEFMDFSELPFLFSLNNITISDSTLTFEDLPNSTTHNVDKIELSLPNLSNFPYQAGKYIEPRFSAVINGSPIELTGKAGMGGGNGTGGRETHLACQLDNIDISKYFSYLPAHLPLEITNGKADGKLMLTFTPGAKNEKLLVEFNLQATDLEIQDDNQTYALMTPSANFEGAIQPVTGDTYIRQIVLDKPHLRSQQGKYLKIPSLFAYTMETEADPDLPERKRPTFAIDSLIADNGTFTILDNGSDSEIDKWQNIQFSLKDFTSSSNSPKDKPLPSFVISGEKSSSHTTINWQGQVKPHFHLSGDFRLDNMPTTDLFDWFKIKDLGTVSGTSSLEAHLALANTGEKEKPVSTTIKEGTVILHDLTLGNGKTKWYTSPVTRFDNFSAVDSKVSLGDVRLKNSSVRLDVDSLPKLFPQLGKQDSNISFKALEFTGTLQLLKSSAKIPAIQLSSATLQAINLDDPSKTVERDNLTFKASLADKGEIQAKGKVTLETFSVILNTAFSQLPSSQILPWFGSASSLTETKGGLSGNGTFVYPELSFNGQIAVNNGQYGKSDTTKISWDQFTFKDFRFSKTPLHIGASEAVLTSPVIPFAKDAASRHPAAIVASFLNSQLPEETDDKKSSISMSTIEIPQLSVTDGTINILDTRLTPNWKGTVSYFRGTLDNLFSKRNGTLTSPFSFSGSLDGIPFSIEGELNPFDNSAKGNALFNMKGYPLPAFQKQLLHQVDVDSSFGEFSLTTRSDWNGGQISERNQLLFHNIRPLSRDARSALTLALITDNDQQFELLVNSKNYFEEKSDPLFTDTLTSFQKLMVKTSFSPYLVATGDFRDIEGKEYAEFVPGQLVLSDQGQYALTRFASLLKAHPNLGVTVTGGVDSVADRSALYEELEQVELERVSTENHRRAMALNEAREKYTQKVLEEREKNGGQQIVETDLPPELLAPFTPLEPEPVVIEDSMLENLAARRAQVIVDFFTTKLALEPERIKVAPHQILSEDNTSGNKVIFTLTVY